MRRDYANPAVWSTTAQPVASPSTGTLVAEIDSTQLGTQNFAVNQKVPVMVTWVLGGDTNVTWQCEVASSTSLSAAVDTVFVKTPTGQSGEYITHHDLLKDYRIRARVNSTFTASVTASISAERLT